MYTDISLSEEDIQVIITNPLYNGTDNTDQYATCDDCDAANTATDQYIYAINIENTPIYAAIGDKTTTAPPAADSELVYVSVEDINVPL